MLEMKATIKNKIIKNLEFFDIFGQHLSMHTDDFLSTQLVA